MIVWLAALLILVFDQWSKVLIRANFALGENLQIISGFFNATYIRNSGAVWGILQNSSQYLTFFSIAVMILISLFIQKITERRIQNEIAIGLILGGIAGNMIDRIKYGAVTDFLDFYVSLYHWPAFNIADAAICVGTFMYIVFAIIRDITKRANNVCVVG